MICPICGKYLYAKVGGNLICENNMMCELSSRPLSESEWRAISKKIEDAYNAGVISRQSDYATGQSVAFERAREMGERLAENINPASNKERVNKIPGGDAMGAVIEYRDKIHVMRNPYRVETEQTG